ncbi:MAG: hypothetical protein EBV06_17080, partial [Planctomycetia bacterium]|nr:hypothetical protein [Planctomycetia bacterium]
EGGAELNRSSLPLSFLSSASGITGLREARAGNSPGLKPRLRFFGAMPGRNDAEHKKDRGREDRLSSAPPSLRTGLADLPHPALRLMVLPS